MSTPELIRELQQTEIEVLKSIYGDDFLANPLPNQPKAWGKVGGVEGGEFGIRLSGKHDLGDNGDVSARVVSVVLVVKYTKMYPKLSPNLSFAHSKNVSASQLSVLTKLVNHAAREQIGDVVVFNLASFIEDWLTDNVKPPAPPPTKDFDPAADSLAVLMSKREEEQKVALYESNQIHQTELARKAQERAHLLTQQVNEHKRLQLTRQAELAVVNVSNNLSHPGEWTEVTFGANDENSMSCGIEGSFTIVGGVKDKLWTTYIAIPKHQTIVSLPNTEKPSIFDAPGQLHDTSITMVDFPTAYYSSAQGSHKLNNLFETMKTKVLALKSDQVVPVLAVRLTEIQTGVKKWKRLCLLTGRIGRGERLKGILRVCGRLDIELAKDHFIQLLAGLEAMRKQGVTHDDICLETVILSCRSGDARLSEPCYRRRIIDMDRSNPFSDAPSLIDEEIYEIGDQGSGRDLPWNWLSPDEIEAGHAFNHKRDVWHATVTFLRMMCGADVVYKYPNLQALIASNDFYFPEALVVILQNLLNPIARERWTADQAVTKLSNLNLTVAVSGKDVSKQDLRKCLSSTFGLSKYNKKYPGISGPHNPFFDGAGAEHQLALTSRYRADFEEVEFLGEGGFGKVVKAKNKLDGRFYAIKKVKLRPEDNEQKVFREVNALSRLNHQFIVRYYTCWLEETAAIVPVSVPTVSEPATMTSSLASLGDTSGATTPSISFGGFDFKPTDNDFLSVRGTQSRSHSFPSIHFGDDEQDDDDDDRRDDDEEDESDDTSEDSSTEEEVSKSRLLVSTPTGHAVPGQPSFTDGSMVSSDHANTRVLYIQMEYVENQTLKESIARGLTEEQAWRLFRQILEALTHMANLGIVHRDLKPSNLLIGVYILSTLLCKFRLASNANLTFEFTDHENCIKIGDFGLAATDLASTDASMNNTPNRSLADSVDLTSGIGTSLYIAPEVESGTARKDGSRYDDKADLYSLGIIFFEMNFPLSTGMERALVIRSLRTPSIVFPSSWPSVQKSQQTKVISLLLQHDPTRRPRAITLLTNGMLPSIKEDEYFLEALRTFGNPTSTRYPVLFNHIFSQIPDAVADFTFDDPDGGPRDHRVYESMVKERLIDLFRRHGAIDWEPPPLLPVTELLGFRKEPGARFLNRQGQQVELPYDGLVSFARDVARTKLARLKRYHIGQSYRESVTGGQPTSFGEVAYDILSPVRSMASEAELIAVLDRILDMFPALSTRYEWEFQINHSSVLSSVLSHVPSKRRLEVCDMLKDIGPKVSFAQLRSRLNLSRPIVDELEKWYIDEPFLEAGTEKLQQRFPQALSALHNAISEIKQVISFAEKFGVRRKIIFKPTTSSRPTVFKSGVFFECVRKSQKREVLAVGGRYDNLVDHFRLPQSNNSTSPTSNIVGMQIAFERIIFLVGKYESDQLKRLVNLDNEEARSFGWTPRRCDVYIGSFSQGLIGDRVEIAGELWAAALSADLMYEDAVGSGLEEVSAECLAQGVLFLVICKGRPLLKVRSILRRYEEDVYREDLLPYLRQQIADQRRVDMLSVPMIVASNSMSHMGSEQLANKANGSSGYVELIRLILPGEKGKEGKMGGKKLHRYGSKTVYYEKARNFLDYTKSSLPLYALDVTFLTITQMVLDPTWLLAGEDSSIASSDLWKEIKESIPIPGYANTIKIELRDAWLDGMIGGVDGSTTMASRPMGVWLFSLREDRGQLLQWPKVS
ncbi:eIF-2alpha kinase GCN2 [Phaffia rhodozyma]|uniref:non-specific serine/threonine protein kinase n=1 Tax=Phaffia rhodozyma TaxID=264483 RepID=A0A0F7SNU2_PHARH|nr:eIF-2alpha kinase GCN2 [Phaffia rhodozyma]